MTRRSGLSKSRITLFEQCPKRLWLSVHRPDLAEEQQSTRQAFADGHGVGELACSLHPDGIMIEDGGGLGKALDQTAELLATGWDRPVFEATFARDGVLVRVDILEPADGGWHLAEVKNMTGMKGYHVSDIATQLWVMQESGIKVRSAAVRHLNRDFTLTREGDYAGLFLDTRVDELVAPIVESREETVAAARATLEGDEPPIEPGDHCTNPFTCSFMGWCGRNLPPAPVWPVTLLPDAAGKRIARELLEQGIDDLAQAPAEAMTSPKLARVHHATVSGEPWHDAVAIRAETSGWAFPRTFLDFETIQFSIPRWIGTRPFQQVPFQFSAHVMAQDGTLSHVEFLSLDGSDPRRACAEALAGLPAEGAVIAWNMAFERGCLFGLAGEFPDLAPALESLAGRLVDLLPVVRRHYYHRDMHGSWSIKAVLPTLASTGYADLVEVKSGIDAQAGYLEAIAPGTSPRRREALGDALLEYCRRDTEAMMVVLDALTGKPG